MEYLLKFCDFITLCFSVISEIWTDLVFKIAGNLFPLYVGAFILLLVDQESIHKVLDPQSFILYSSTFLFSAMYLWYKTLDTKNKNGLIVFLVFLLTAILISLMYAFTFTKKLDTKFDVNYWSYYVFSFSIIIYIIYECISYFKANKSNFSSASNDDYNRLRGLFKK